MIYFMVWKSLLSSTRNKIENVFLKNIWNHAMRVSYRETSRLAKVFPFLVWNSKTNLSFLGSFFKIH